MLYNLILSRIVKIKTHQWCEIFEKAYM